MFTRLIFCCLCLLIISNTYAQRGKSHFLGGLVVGASTSQIDGDRAQGYTTSDIILGGYVNCYVSPGFMLQSEMLYYQLGGKTTGPVDFSQRNAGPIDISLPSLSLPIMAKFRLGQDEFLSNTWLVMGPALGVQMYGQDKTNNSPEIADLNRYDMRFIVGGELGIGDFAALNINFTYSVIPMVDTEIEVESTWLQQDNTLGVKWFHNYLSASLRINLMRDRR